MAPGRCCSSRYSASEDVLFGSVVSGRPADLAGAESMIGLFLNTLPVRVRIPGDAVVLPWLQSLQAQQAEARQYEYSPLAQVQGWSAVERGRPLFESILSFENYPIEELALGAPNMQIQDGRAIERTNYPLNLSVIPGAELALKLIYDRRRFDAATIERLAGHLQTLLLSLVADPDQRLADVEMLTDAEQQPAAVRLERHRRRLPAWLPPRPLRGPGGARARRHCGGLCLRPPRAAALLWSR